MAEILVLGAGLTGLTTAMLLARDGHDVTVLERDAADPPPGVEASWTGWDRAGVAQFRQLHLMLPRWREVIETELPDVLDALRAVGGLDHNMLHHRPPRRPAAGSPETSGSRWSPRAGRCSEAVAGAAASCPGLRIRRGVAVAGLLTADGGAVRRGWSGPDRHRRRPGRPRRGRRWPALAAGRWIVDVEGRAPVDERADCGFVYYDGTTRRDARRGRLDAESQRVGLRCSRCPRTTGPGVGITTSSRDRALRRCGTRRAGGGGAATRPPRDGSTPSRSPGSR
jgi:hypothetical protein